MTKVTDLLLAMGTDGVPGVRFVVSTRYAEDLARRAQPAKVEVWNLSEGVGRDETRADVRALLEAGLTSLARRGVFGSAEDLAAVVDGATERSDGNFLYASLLLRSLRDRTVPFGLTDLATVPRGLDGFLDGYLRQIVGSDRQTTWLGGYQPVMSVLSVARQPADETLLAP
jgi:hypothetical protein